MALANASITVSTCGGAAAMARSSRPGSGRMPGSSGAVPRLPRSGSMVQLPAPGLLTSMPSSRSREYAPATVARLTRSWVARSRSLGSLACTGSRPSSSRLPSITASRWWMAPSPASCQPFSSRVRVSAGTVTVMEASLPQLAGALNRPPCLRCQGQVTWRRSHSAPPRRHA